MKDFIGQEINIGDKVAYITTYGQSKKLRNGTVTGFTPEFVNISGDRKSPDKLVVVTLNRHLIDIGEDVRRNMEGRRGEEVLRQEPPNNRILGQEHPYRQEQPMMPEEAVNLQNNNDVLWED